MTEQKAAEHLTLLARHLLMAGNAADALALLDSAVAMWPDDADTIALQCEAAHHVGRNDEAHERLTALLASASPERRQVLARLDARVLLALGREREATELYERTLPASAGPFDPDPEA
jgi:hypothetical protein